MLKLFDANLSYACDSSGDEFVLLPVSHEINKKADGIMANLTVVYFCMS